MNSSSKKYFHPVPNYDAAKEKLEAAYTKPTEEDVRSFLNFWQDAYDLWKQKYSPFDLKSVDEVIRVRKLLIEKFGIRA